LEQVKPEQKKRKNGVKFRKRNLDGLYEGVTRTVQGGLNILEGGNTEDHQIEGWHIGNIWRRGLVLKNETTNGEKLDGGF